MDGTEIRASGEVGRHRLGRRATLGLMLALALGLMAPLGAVSAASARSLAGQAWAWGSNRYGQLGNGASGSYGVGTSPVRVHMPAGTKFTAISAGANHSLALDTTGKAWAWGQNQFGQLGNGTTANQYTTGSTIPVRVHMPAGTRFTAISAGAGHNLALDATGQIWAWGDGGNGELGDGTFAGRHTIPVRVHMPAGTRFTAISAGDDYSLAIDSTGQAWAWGLNNLSQLGDGTTTDRSTPVRVHMPAGTKFTAISAGSLHSLALDATGKAWAWGQNQFGQLGNGSTTERSSPVRVHMPAGTKFTAISTGNLYSLALDTTGKAWAWGFNRDGEVGDGTTTQRTSPVRVHMPAGTTVTAISAGAGHNLAIDSTGRMWAWGINRDGEVGDGTTTQRTSPVRVHVPADRKAIAVAAGRFHSLALLVPKQPR